MISGCGGENNYDDNIIIIQNGEIFGTVTDKETGITIKGVTIQIGEATVLTDDSGKYSIKNIPFSDNVAITATASEYNDYHGSVSLQQELLSLNIAMIPVKSPSAPIIAVLEAISKSIESLDDAKIPEIQSYFSKDYVAGDDEATAFGIFAGVIPPDYETIPETMKNINKKYSKLEFTFNNPEVEFDGDLANVKMRFIVNAETNPPEPKIWDIIVDGKMTFEQENGEWKMTLWALIPPFIKFEDKPL